MAKAKKRRPRDKYAESMRVWLKQSKMEVESCEQNIARFQDELRFYAKAIKHAGRAIALEREQITIARRRMRAGKRELERHLKSSKK